MRKLTRREAIRTGSLLGGLTLGFSSVPRLGQAAGNETKSEDRLAALTNYLKSRGVNTGPPRRPNRCKVLAEANWYEIISRPNGGGPFVRDQPVPSTLVPRRTQWILSSPSWSVFWLKNGQLAETPLANVGVWASIDQDPTTDKWIHRVRVEFSDRADDVDWSVFVLYDFLFLG